MWFDNFNLISIKGTVFYLPFGQYEIYYEKDGIITFYIPQNKFLIVEGTRINGYINFDYNNRTILSGTLINMKCEVISCKENDFPIGKTTEFKYLTILNPISLDILEAKDNDLILKIIPDSREIIEELFKQIPNLHPIIKQYIVEKPDIINKTPNILGWFTASDLINEYLKENTSIKEIGERRIKEAIAQTKCDIYYIDDIFNYIMKNKKTH